MMSHFYILGCIFFTVYGQLIIKWRVSLIDFVPISLGDKLVYFFALIFKDFFILSAFLSAFFASICWMLALTKFPLSYAYPFMTLSIILVMAMSVFIFGEEVNVYKLVGTMIVVLGVLILSRGYT